MSGPNTVVVALLREHAALVRSAGGDAARYDAAATAIDGVVDDVSRLDLDALVRIPGVDRPIAAEILEFLDTGHVEAVDVLGPRSTGRTFVPSGYGS